jgi:CRP-like cAMP-binding protein
MKYVTYEPNATIIEPGDPATKLLVVTSGEMDMTVEYAGHDLLALTLKAVRFEA